MDELRIVIAGSRDFNDYELLKREVLNIIKYDNRPKDYMTVISGGARGAKHMIDLANKYDWMYML